MDGGLQQLFSHTRRWENDTGTNKSRGEEARRTAHARLSAAFFIVSGPCCQELWRWAGLGTRKAHDKGRGWHRMQPSIVEALRIKEVQEGQLLKQDPEASDGCA